MNRVPDREPDLAVTVFGVAKGKGSVTAFIPKRGDGSMVTRGDGSPMVVKTDDSGKAGREWRESIAGAVAAEMNRTGFRTVPPRVPVVIEMVFFRVRAASHFGTGRNSLVLKGSAPALPSVKPDVDKLARGVLDALKGVAWHDDGQVTGAPAWKDFGTPARLELRLWQLPATVADLAQPKLVDMGGESGYHSGHGDVHASEALAV